MPCSFVKVLPSTAVSGRWPGHGRIDYALPPRESPRLLLPAVTKNEEVREVSEHARIQHSRRAASSRRHKLRQQLLQRPTESSRGR